ncbi:MAG TPA: ABC transporter permease [Longimicrobium sp.]|nr:ABC transporter permease [Longimicrobium sp.]
MNRLDGKANEKDELPEGGRLAWLVGMALDLKLGFRMLLRYPGLTIVAVLALSVAIGGGAAYLEFVNDLFRPKLPFQEGHRLVGIYTRNVATGGTDEHPLHDFLAWRGELRTVEGVGAFQPLERNLITADGRTEPVRGVEISASAFRLVQARPRLGRPLVDADEQPGAPPVVVLGHDLWQARFGGDRGVVGRTVRLGNTVHSVVGVMPDGFGFPVNHGLWVPLRVSASDHPRGQGPALKMFGRLAPGVGIDAAQAELAASGARLAREFPRTNEHLRPLVKPYVTALWASRPDGGLQMGILYAFNLFFVGLLAVCAANVATLVFARTATRESEISVRSALGASRGRITAQIFAEALVLATVAAVVGLAAASFGLRWVSGTLQRAGAQLPFWADNSLAPTTLLYAALLTLITAMIVGIVPALKATGPHIQARLKRAASGGGGMKFGGVWTGVIVTQVALTVIFLLIVVSVGWNVYVGRYGTTRSAFATDEFFSARLEMDGANVADVSTEAARAEFRNRFQTTYQELERRLAAEPAVTGVTYASALPGTSHPWLSIDVDGVAAPESDGGAHLVRTASVAAGFFRALDAPVLSGRAFDAGDVEFDRNVVIVDQTFVRTILGGRNPIGRRIRQAAVERETTGEWQEIVGVVRNLTLGSEGTAEDAVLYRPAAPGGAYPVHMAVHVRGDPKMLAPRLRTLAADVDPTLRLYDLMPMNEIGQADQMTLGIWARVLALVGAITLLLSTAGVYSLMSFTVTRRTREIGIRAAVGASPRSILRSIFTPALAQVGIGVVAGSIPGSFLVAWGFPEVARGAGLALGGAAFLVVAAFMLGVALLACVVPARRALRIPPTEALRAAG